jgi:hypothetical protein
MDHVNRMGEDRSLKDRMELYEEKEKSPERHWKQDSEATTDKMLRNL